MAKLDPNSLLAQMLGDTTPVRVSPPNPTDHTRTVTAPVDTVAAIKALAYCPRCRANGLGSRIDSDQEARSKIVSGYTTTNHYHTCAKGLAPHIDSYRKPEGGVVRSSLADMSQGTAPSAQAPEVFIARTVAVDPDGTRTVIHSTERSEIGKVLPPRPSREGVSEWDTPGYSPVDAARVNEDLSAARVAGFALRDEVFTRGELVNMVGVANARAKRDDWLGLPPAVDGCMRLDTIVTSEKREDMTVDIDDMRMDAGGRIVVPGVAPLYIERDALAQVFQRISATCGVSSPGGAMVDWTRPRLVSGRVAVFNALCEQAGEDATTRRAEHARMLRLPKAKRPENFKAKPPTEPAMVLRTRLDDKGARAVFAGVSTKYGACDTDVIARACASAAEGKDLRADIFYDRQRCKIDLLTHSPVPAEHCAVGESFQAGIRLETDDTGKGGIKVSAMLWRNLCRNYYVIDESVIALANIRHIGDEKRIAQEVAANLALALSKIDHFVKAWDTGCSRKIVECVRAERGSEKLLRALLDDASHTHQAANLRDSLLAGTFRGLADRKILPIGSRLLEDCLDDLIAAHDDNRNAGAALVRGVPTLASLANAVSLYGHAYQDDPVQEIALERAAGEIMTLSGSVPWVAVA